MNYSRIILSLVFLSFGCLPTVGEGFVIKGKKYSDISEFKTQKIYLDLAYEYGITKEETKTKTGKIERTIDRATPELYMQFKDALFLELRGKYKLDVELGLPKKKDSLAISVTPRMGYARETIGKASILLSKGNDPLYKLDIVNETQIKAMVISKSKTVEQLAELSAEKIYDSISGKSEE